VVFLTVGSRRARVRRRSALGVKQAAKAVGDRGKAAAEGLRASGLRGPIRGTPVEVARRLGRPEVHRWRGTKMRRALTDGGQRRQRPKFEWLTGGARLGCAGDFGGGLGWPESAATDKKGKGRQSRRAGHRSNGCRASRGRLLLEPHPSSGSFQMHLDGARCGGVGPGGSGEGPHPGTGGRAGE
jgi:hypothetical protein